jgi:hypothetical protein
LTFRASEAEKKMGYEIRNDKDLKNVLRLLERKKLVSLTDLGKELVTSIEDD